MLVVHCRRLTPDCSARIVVLEIQTWWLLWELEGGCPAILARNEADILEKLPRE